MPRSCTVCNHAKRRQIDEQLIEAIALGKLAERFGASKTALFRHKRDHVPTHLAKAHEAKEVARADSLLCHVQRWNERTEKLYEASAEILTDAQKSKDHPTALAAITTASRTVREGRGTVELLGRVTGEFEQTPAVNAFIVCLPRVPAPEPLDTVINIVAEGR